MTIMTRDGAKFWWGKELPREIAFMVKDEGDKDFRPVTYKEIFARKKAKQDSNIYAKRAHQRVRPCALWVFWNEPLCGLHTSQRIQVYKLFQMN